MTVAVPFATVFVTEACVTVTIAPLPSSLTVRVCVTVLTGRWKMLLNFCGADVTVTVCV